MNKDKSDIVQHIGAHFPEIKAAMAQIPAVFAPNWLKASATAHSGLNDFGPDYYEPSLARLCDSLNQDADLNAYGRLLLAMTIRNQLVNRQLLQRLRQEQPESLATRPLAPIIVTGLPRTGTTFLHRLLAADPAHASLPFWQLVHPIPLNAEDNEASRIARVNEMIEVRRKLTPELDGTHLIRADSPEECQWLNGSSMMSRVCWNLAPVYGWLKWYLREDKTAKYQEYLEYLSYLQTFYPGQRLVLKAPDHVDAVDELLTVMPEAHIICCHRDMTEQFGSYMSLGRTTRSLATQGELDRAKEADAIRDMTDLSLAHMEQARQHHPGKILDIRYTDLISDPLAVIEKIYSQCGLVLAETRRQALAEHHAANPKGKHGKHDYSLAEFGLDNREIKAHYADYEAQYLN